MSDEIVGQRKGGVGVSARRGGALLSAGGLLGALGAMSCCVLPFALFTIGVGGAWLGNLTALAPYQPIFIAVTLMFLGAGFVLAYRRPKAACAEDGYCARPAAGRAVKIGLWSASALVAVAVAFDPVIRLFY